MHDFYWNSISLLKDSSPLSLFVEVFLKVRRRSFLCDTGSLQPDDTFTVIWPSSNAAHCIPSTSTSVMSIVISRFDASVLLSNPFPGPTDLICHSDTISVVRDIFSLLFADSDGLPLSYLKRKFSWAILCTA